MTTPAPVLGDVVLYRSKIDNGPGNDVLSPAIVVRTRATTVAEVVGRWGPEPDTVVSASDPEVTHETAARPDGVVDELPDDHTVDLAVFGLGQTYREYAVRAGDGRGQWTSRAHLLAEVAYPAGHPPADVAGDGPPKGTPPAEAG